MCAFALPGWLVNPQFIASTSAAFIAAFAGAAVGYWLTRRSDLARDEKESRRRAALAALTGVNFIATVRRSVVRVPPDLKGITDPRTQLQVRLVDMDTVAELLRAAIDLPRPVQLLFGPTIASQWMCAAQFLLAHNRAVELMESGVTESYDVRAWQGSDGEDPVFKQLFLEALKEKMALEEKLISLNSALVPLVQQGVPA